MGDVLAEVGIQRRRFTVEEYYRLAEVGILHEHDRVELIEGEIIVMSPIGLRRGTCVIRLTRELVMALGRRALLSPSLPVRLSPDTEPQPDIALLRPRPDDYAHARARPADALLVVEVAETSYHYDRRVKLPLYARAGVPEYWIVDLRHDIVEVYRDRAADTYASTTSVGRGGAVTPAAFPDVVLPVNDILPPA
jgi:Uma2 family endonuclease